MKGSTSNSRFVFVFGVTGKVIGDPFPENYSGSLGVDFCTLMYRVEMSMTQSWAYKCTDKIIVMSQFLSLCHFPFCLSGFAMRSIPDFAPNNRSDRRVLAIIHCVVVDLCLISNNHSIAITTTSLLAVI